MSIQALCFLFAAFLFLGCYIVSEIMDAHEYKKQLGEAKADIYKLEAELAKAKAHINFLLNEVHRTDDEK